MNGQPTYDELASICVQQEQEIARLEEQLKQEAELRQLEEKYKRLVESLSEEYIFYSHDSAGMVTYVSPSITKILGYSQGESMRNYREFLTDHKMNEEALNHSRASLKGLVQPPFMNELYHIDGSTRIFYNTELPIYDENGRATGVEGIAHDVTKKFAAEEELQKQDEILKLLVDTIEDRCFKIPMVRKTNKEVVKRFNLRRERKALERLQYELALWAEARKQAIMDIYDGIEEVEQLSPLDDRFKDISEILHRLELPGNFPGAIRRGIVNNKNLIIDFGESLFD